MFNDTRAVFGVEKREYLRQPANMLIRTRDQNVAIRNRITMELSHDFMTQCISIVILSSISYVKLSLCYSCNYLYVTSTKKDKTKLLELRTKS